MQELPTDRTLWAKAEWKCLEPGVFGAEKLMGYAAFQLPREPLTTPIVSSRTTDYLQVLFNVYSLILFCQQVRWKHLRRR